MSIYEIFKDIHSWFRYVVFVLVLLAIIQSLIGWLGKKAYTEGNRKINLFALISAHTQLLIGIVLYISDIDRKVQFSKAAMQDPNIRYFTVEHWVMMLIAIVLITIGHSKSKRATLPENKHKTIAIFYIIAILVIIGAIMAGKLPIIGSV